MTAPQSNTEDRLPTFSASIIVIVAAVALGFSAKTFMVPTTIVLIMALHLVWGLTIPTRPFTLISFLMAIPFATWFAYYPTSLPGYGAYSLMRLLPILGFYILFLDIQQILCFRHGGNLQLSLGTGVFAFTLAGAVGKEGNYTNGVSPNPFFLPLACILIGVLVWELRRSLSIKIPMGQYRQFPYSQMISLVAVLGVAIGFQVLLVDELPTMGAWLMNNVTNTGPGGGAVAVGYTHSRVTKLDAVSDMWNTVEDNNIVLRCWSSQAPEYLRGSVYNTYWTSSWHSMDETKKITSETDHNGRHIFPFTNRTSDKVLGVIYPEKDFANTYFIPLGTHQIATFDQTILASEADTARPDGQATTPRGGYEYYEPVEKMSPPTVLDSEVRGPALRKELKRIGAQVFGDATTPEEKIKRLKDYFVKNFKYKLGIPITGTKDPVIEFLEDIKAGHCEYFASAAALLLRSEGIPARYVTGFRCDEPGLTGGYWVSRRKDAHAWVEAYLPKQGWVTVEATPPSAMPTDRSKSLRQTTMEWMGAIVSTIVQFFVYGGITALISAVWDFVVQILVYIPREAFYALVVIGLVWLFRNQIQQAIFGKLRHDSASKRTRELQRRLDWAENQLRRHRIIRPQYMTVGDFIEVVRKAEVHEPLKTEALKALSEYNAQRFMFELPPETRKTRLGREAALQAVGK